MKRHTPLFVGRSPFAFVVAVHGIVIAPPNG